MKKVNTKTKVIALSTAAVMTTAIYLKSDNVTNAEQYAQVSDNAIELNVDKQNKDTIKLNTGIDNSDDFQNFVEYARKYKNGGEYKNIELLPCPLAIIVGNGGNNDTIRAWSFQKNGMILASLK